MRPERTCILPLMVTVRGWLTDCVSVCVVIPIILDVRLVDVPAEVTQKEGHTGFLIHLLLGCLPYFFREKDSAVPFTRRPGSRFSVY